LSALPKEVQDQVRTEANTMSKRLAGQMMQFGLVSPTPQAKLVMESITTPRDRLIRVDIGGTKRLAASMAAKQQKAANAQINHKLPLDHCCGVQNMGRIPVLIEQVADTQTDLRLPQIRAVIG
jgi:hypothetical protein